MKKLLITTFILACFAKPLLSQAPNWVWAKNAGSTGLVQNYGLSTDAAGTSYVTGSFDGSSIAVGSITVQNNGPSTAPDIYIAKYDVNGSVLWATGAGGIYLDEGLATAVDAAGNFYVTGYFESPQIFFGSITLTNVAPGWADVFLVKYSPSGVVQWATTIGGQDSDKGLALAVDAQGNCIVSGIFYSPSVAIGTLSLANATVSAPATSDLFIAKFSTTGVLLWGSRAGGNDSDFATSVAADPAGNIFTSGHFASSSIAFGTTTLTNSGNATSWEVFITKFSSSGTPQWAVKTAGTTNEFCYGLTVDNNGDIVITGYFDYSQITVGTTSLTNAGILGTYDLFVAKYSTAGTFIWAARDGGPGNEHSRGIVHDAQGNLYLTGYYYDASTTTLAGSTFTMKGYSDIFVEKCTGAGSFTWATSIGSTTEDFSLRITKDAAGSFYIAGGHANALSFGSLTLNPITANYLSGLIAKFNLSQLSSISDSEIKSYVNVFPNPTSGIIEIEMPESHLLSLHLYDVYGKLIFSEFEGQRQTLDLREFEIKQGLYYLQIETTTGFFKSKVIYQ